MTLLQVFHSRALVNGEALRSSPMAATMGRTCDGQRHLHAIDVSQLKDFELMMFRYVFTQRDSRVPDWECDSASETGELEIGETWPVKLI